MKKKIIALIPARAGSKRIKNKNLQDINGKPLIYYSINYALNSKIFDKVIVSTNSRKIRSEALKYGAQVPFIRPNKISSDKTSDFEVFKHTLDWLKNNENYYPEYIVYLRPTTPFRTKSLLKSCLSLIIKKGCSSVRSARNIGHAHPYWMYYLKDNKPKEFLKEKNFFKYYQSQLLPVLYKHDGYCDIVSAKNFKEKYLKNKLKLKILYGKKMLFFENKDSLFLNIDNKNELINARYLYKKLINDKKYF